MSLQVWLPLNGDLHNQGLSNLTITNNGATINDNGKIGKCYFFNSNYIKITNLSIPINAWSLTAWVYLQADSSDSHQYIVGLNTSSASDFLGVLCFYQNKFGVRTAGTTYSSPNTSALNNWYHICATYNGTSLKLYVNGILVLTKSSPAAPKAASTCYIGTRGGIAGNFYGKINDVRIYDHTLSDKEVEEISKGLILHYQLNGSGFKNPNLLLDTNVSSLTKVKASYNRYYESGSSGTYTAVFESINNPPVAHIKYGVHYTVTSVGGFHGLTWYSGGTVSVTNEPYTISCYVKKISTGNMSIKFQYGKSPYVSKTINLINDNQWHQYSWTFTPDTASGKAAADGTTRIYGGGPNTVGEVIICGWKLEKGEFVTPWCESEDEGFEPSLIIHDSSGYNNNGNISSGNIKLILSPRYNVGSNSLNAIDTKIITTLNGLPSILANGEKYTLACWARPTGTNANGWVIQLGNNQCGLWWAKSEARWVWNENDNGKRCANPTISSDYTNWHHLVTTVDKTNSTAIIAKHYVDGQPAEGYTSQTWNGSTFIQPTGDTITYYLQNSDLSDVRLYTTILTADQIKELYEISKIIDGTTIKARDLEVST